MHVTGAFHGTGTEASPMLLSPSCQNDTFLALNVQLALTSSSRHVCAAVSAVLG